MIARPPAVTVAFCGPCARTGPRLPRPRAQEDPCSPRSLRRSGRPTCARSCSSRWRSSRSSGSARSSRPPACRPPSVQACIDQATPGNPRPLRLINLFSGGALLQLSVFALGIMPYITASIIVQLLAVVIPRFEALKKEGQAGTGKLTQYTRYLTIGLAILQSTGLVALARSRAAASRAATDRHSSPTRASSRIVDHGHHDDRRHRRHHVARRADHRPRHRQRHVDADLHLDRGPLPGRSAGQILQTSGGWSCSPWSSLSAWSIVAAGGLRRAGAAPHPGAVREAHGRPADVRRHVDLHPAQGQPGRRHPGHLRLVAALPAGADRSSCPSNENPPAGAASMQQLPDRRRPPGRTSRSTSC